MDLARYIDHTLLRVDCSEADIRKLCQEAMEHGFATVCIPPFFVALVRQLLEQHSSKLRLATVVGFPLGYSCTPSKVEEIKKAADDGADEIDAVINLCAVKSSQWSFVENDIDSMCTAARLRGKKIQIALEAALLSEEEIRRLAKILLASKPDFVKASTGFNGSPTLETVYLLKESLENQIPINAAGDIHIRQEAEAFIKAGVQRISTSSGVLLMKGEPYAN
ncbi:MAG: deoxyribose-phosphate aldolase [Haliscomenobacter sp.]|nr:deoxyribose-phosphate aldolase [Haliscomenobacter sp.]MBK7477186.1 deoxyribose-phosphate aldolase [Haliscomenobacter sp.]MBK8878682.1 deoxyribose-phosphate aldolase [Haliscomenobacter sp.]